MQAHGRRSPRRTRRHPGDLTVDAQTTAAPIAPAPQDTPSWLAEHCPRAVRWHRLWLADREALRIAREAVDALTDTRAERLLLEHSSAERTASLWYLSELLTAECHATLALDAHDVRPATVERLTARRIRLCQLIDEVVKASAPTEPTKPGAKP